MSIAATLYCSRFPLHLCFFFGARGVVEADANDTKEDAEIKLHKDVPGGLWRAARHNSGAHVTRHRGQESNSGQEVAVLWHLH
jgi:hypothetical protein